MFLNQYFLETLSNEIRSKNRLLACKIIKAKQYVLSKVEPYVLMPNIYNLDRNANILLFVDVKRNLELHLNVNKRKTRSN